MVVLVNSKLSTPLQPSQTRFIAPDWPPSPTKDSTAIPHITPETKLWLPHFQKKLRPIVSKFYIPSFVAHAPLLVSHQQSPLSSQHTIRTPTPLISMIKTRDPKDLLGGYFYVLSLVVYTGDHPS
jgi:hypothetical protein